jgi:hypothetical protein
LIECFFNKIKHYRRIFSGSRNLPGITRAFCILPQLRFGCGEMST